MSRPLRQALLPSLFVDPPAVLLAALVFVLSLVGFGALGLPAAGTVAVAVSLGLVLWLRVRRAQPWSWLGLEAPASIPRLGLHSALALIVGWAAALAALVLARQVFGWAPMDTSRFADVQGNVVALAGMLAISWSTAAFGEEVLFRGFLQQRLREWFSALPACGLLAALLQALLFGLGHAYQGATGILVSASIGLAFGLLRLRLRSVWPLVIAHGLIDTVSMLALYAGAQTA